MKKQFLLLVFVAFIISSCSWESNDHFDKVEEFRPILAQNDSLVNVITSYALIIEDINKEISSTTDESVINQLSAQLSNITIERNKSNELLSQLDILGRYPQIKNSIESYNEIIKRLGTTTYSIYKLVITNTENNDPTIAEQLLQLSSQKDNLVKERAKAKADLLGELVRSY